LLGDLGRQAGELDRRGWPTSTIRQSIAILSGIWPMGLKTIERYRLELIEDLEMRELGR
jgi:hypothetical protein